MAQLMVVVAVLQAKVMEILVAFADAVVARAPDPTSRPGHLPQVALKAVETSSDQAQPSSDVKENRLLTWAILC